MLSAQTPHSPKLRYGGEISHDGVQCFTWDFALVCLFRPPFLEVEIKNQQDWRIIYITIKIMRPCRRRLPTYKRRIKNENSGVADGLFCREIDGLFCRSSPDIIVRRRCVLSHKRRGWLQPSPSFRYSRNLALQDELYHPVINNGPAVLVCVDKRLGTGPVNQSRDAG